MKNTKEQPLHRYPQRICFRIIAFFIFFLAYQSNVLSASTDLSPYIQAMITQPGKISCEKNVLCGSALILNFYQEREFQPVWIKKKKLNRSGKSLIEVLHKASAEGLNPDDYHLASIESLAQKIDRHQKDPQTLASLDLLLTDAFLLYGSHLANGRVNPETIHPNWSVYSKKFDLLKVLQDAITSHEIEETLMNLLPPYAGYTKLKDSLRYYREIADSGGWVKVPEGPTMREDTIDGRVEILRKRLFASGDLDHENGDYANVYDKEVAWAVQRFQDRHGLIADGVVGYETLTQLNIPVEKRMRQIELSMERWRWLSRDLGTAYILVNAAGFQLDVIENDSIVMSMKAVVGKNYRSTPAMSGTITQIVINPYWGVPKKIFIEDMLPELKKDPLYLEKKNIRVFKSWEATAPEINSAAIDWFKVTKENFHYVLRQDPGPQNSLGRIKFVFRNKYGVYLHDTPYKELFSVPKRDFSSGCIRIEQPIDLAVYLLRDNPGWWTTEKIERAINSGKTQWIGLKTGVPVHLLYWTSWIDEESVIHFREDIYGRDALLDKALKERSPTH